MEQTPHVAPKKRGRPRKHPPPDPEAPKRKPGRPRKELPPEDEQPKRPRGRPRKEDQPEPEIPDSLDSSALEWAQAILWAVENTSFKTLPKVKVGGKKKAPSAIQKALWEFGQENEKSLVVNLMPRALDIINKHAANQVEDDVAAAEQEAVQEIDKLLEAAIKEAEG